MLIHGFSFSVTLGRGTGLDTETYTLRLQRPTEVTSEEVLDFMHERLHNFMLELRAEATADLRIDFHGRTNKTGGLS